MSRHFWKSLAAEVVKKNGDVEEGDFRSFCTQREVSETHHLDPRMFDNY